MRGTSHIGACIVAVLAVLGLQVAICEYVVRQNAESDWHRMHTSLRQIWQRAAVDAPGRSVRLVHSSWHGQAQSHGVA